MSDNKTTNPKDAVGIRKLSFSVLPWRVLCHVALAMLEGACKYGRHNYRAAGVRASVYFDATVGRHLTQWWEGEDIDAPSGKHHIDKAIASLMVLRDSMLQGNFVDDRPPCGHVDMDELNEHAGQIIDTHADKHPKHWTITDELVKRDSVDSLNLESCDGTQAGNDLLQFCAQALAPGAVPAQDVQSIRGRSARSLVQRFSHGPLAGVEVRKTSDPTYHRNLAGSVGTAKELAR